MSWIKFHSELREGAKRGLPRATRFVFLELSLLTRNGRGETALPLGMSDVDAVHDMLGGSRREVVEALKLLTAGPTPMVEFFDGPAGRSLRIPSWSTWNKLDVSTERVAKHRGAAKRNADVTRYIDVGNANVTPPDQIRSDQKREREARARGAGPEARPDPGPITRGPTPADLEPEVRVLLELRRHEVLVTGAASGCDLPELASALLAPLITRAPSPEGISRWLPAIAVAIADAAAELGSRAAAGAPVSPEEAASLLRRYVGSTLRKPVPPPLPEPDTPALPPGIVPAGTIDRTAKPPPPRTATARQA